MRKAYLQMHIAILLWGFTGIFGKAINMNEGMIVWYRMLISSLGLLSVLLLSKKSVILPKKDIFKISLVGIIVCLHWITFYAAIKISNVSITLSCFSSITLFTAVLEPLFSKKKPHASELILGIGVMAGIYIIFAFQEFYFTGIVIALISAFLGSIFTVINKKLVGKYEPQTVTFYELTSGFLFLSFVLPIYLDITRQNFSIPSAVDSIYLLLLSLLCTTLAFTISLNALKKINAFTMNLSVNLEPVYSIILAILIFKENKSLNAGFFAGTFIILSAVVIHSYFVFKNRKKVSPNIIP